MAGLGGIRDALRRIRLERRLRAQLSRLAEESQPNDNEVGDAASRFHVVLARSCFELDATRGSVRAIKRRVRPGDVRLVHPTVFFERATYVGACDKQEGLFLKVARAEATGARFRQAVANRLKVESLSARIALPGIAWMAADQSAMLECEVRGEQKQRLRDLSDPQQMALAHALISLNRSSGITRTPGKTAYRRTRQDLLEVLANQATEAGSFPVDHLDALAESVLLDDADIVGTRLAHRDLVLWLNVIWSGGDTPVFIDWEDAGTASILYDAVTLLAFEGFRQSGPQAFHDLRELAAGRGPFSTLLPEAVRGEAARVAPSRAHVFLACVELMLNRTRKKGYSQLAQLRRYLDMLDWILQPANGTQSFKTWSMQRVETAE